MGLRFRKSFKIAPGVRVNLNKKSASISVGTKGARITKSTSGRTTTTVGLPGTGLSYSHSSTSKQKKSSTVKQSVIDTQPSKVRTKERVKYPPRRPVEYTPPVEKRAAAEPVPPTKKQVEEKTVPPAEPLDTMMVAYNKNPKSYTRQMKIMKVLAPILCVLAAVLMLASPIPFAVLYLIGLGLGTMPRTFNEKKAEQPVTPIYKRKAVMAAFAVLVIWFILCISVQ